MTETTPVRPCPICGKPADVKVRPFCSARCADVDLNRWFAGVYAVPAADSEHAGEPPIPREEAAEGKT
jgi:endogenous inhibitor of DNA gyrase (YacG/DUF329 family)